MSIGDYPRLNVSKASQKKKWRRQKKNFEQESREKICITLNIRIKFHSGSLFSLY